MDFLPSLVKIDRQVASRNGEPAWKPTKTPASVRMLPLDNGVVEALAKHLAVHPRRTSAMIFTTLQGRALDLNSCYGSTGRGGWFGRAARASGLSDEITFHDLRRFHASLLIRNAAGVKTVQARLGHASATETLDTYGHLLPDADEQTRNILDSAPGGLQRAYRIPDVLGHR